MLYALVVACFFLVTSFDVYGQDVTPEPDPSLMEETATPAPPPTATMPEPVPTDEVITPAMRSVSVSDSYSGLESWGTVNISGGEFRSNSNNAIENHGPMTVDGVLFQDNHDPESGGAIYNSGNLHVSNSIFLNNWAHLFGGAIRSQGTTHVTSSVLRMNHVDDPTCGKGGAIFGSATFTQSCIADNVTTGTGRDIEGESSVPNAAGNWWGAADGPYVGPGTGSGDSYSGDSYLPFLTEPVGGCSLPGLVAVVRRSKSLGAIQSTSP